MIFTGIKIILVRKYLVSKLKVTLQVNCFVAVYWRSTSHQTLSISEHCRNTLSVWSSCSNHSLSWNDRQLNLFKIPSSCANIYIWAHPVTGEIHFWGWLAGAQPADCWLALHRSCLHLWHCLCYWLQAGLWVHRAQASHLQSCHTPCSLRHCGSFLQRSFERRSYWSQHKLALLAHWWWAGNWIIRHTLPLMGFFPPCLCRSFGRIKASMYHRYVKEKSGVKMECSWKNYEKKFSLVYNFINN